MRGSRHAILGLLLLLAADALSPMPSAFCWESSSLFVDAVIPVGAQRAAAPAVVRPGRRPIEAHASLLSGMSVRGVRETIMRGTLRTHIKRDQSALVPSSPSEDH